MEENLDNRIRETLFPKRIVFVEGTVDGTQMLLQPCDLQIGLSEQHLVRIDGVVSIVLDFGRELHGSVRILTQTPARVRIRTGESVSECCAELGERGACNDHSPRDIQAQLPLFSDLTFLQTGFRFVRVDFLDETVVFLKAIVAVSIMRNLTPVGSFVCSDERVNEIFAVASRTLFLNMQTYIWDGIKRDRLVWVGDMHPETLGIMSLFGADELVERSLFYTSEHTKGIWMNGIPTYTAWWLIIVSDYYLHNKNDNFLKKVQESILDAFQMIDGAVDEDGDITVFDSCLFDWPSHGSEDEKEGIRAIFTLCSRKTEVLFRALSLDCAPCISLNERLNKKKVCVKKFKQCMAFSVYSGREDAKNAYPFLIQGGARGVSTFMSYYILSAISDARHSEDAVALMKDYYGGMLDMGATSFWEDFDLDWMNGSAPIDRLPKEGEKDIHGDFGKHCYVGFRHSLCHGWSCGPIPFLIEKLAGIEILEAGCKKVRVKPVSGGLSWYKLQYPVPQGIISVEYRNGDIQVTVPDGVEVC